MAEVVLEHQAEMRARIEAAAAHLADALDAAQAARELRDQLIVRAVDEGVATTRVGKWAGISQTRVMGVLAES